MAAPIANRHQEQVPKQRSLMTAAQPSSLGMSSAGTILGPGIMLS